MAGLTAKYALTLDDYLAFAKVFEVLTPLRRAMRAVMWGMIGLISFAAVYTAIAGNSLMAAYWAGLALLMLAFPLVIGPWTTRRTYHRQHLDGVQIIFVADDEGFRLTTDRSDASMTWAAVRRADDISGHVLLWPNQQLGYIIPKRAFASPADAEAFAKLAKEKTAGQTL